MESVKGIAEMFERLLYEALGLLIPGAALAIALAAAASVVDWSDLLQFADTHEGVMLAASYALGYVVQGLSRPITWLWDAALILPLRAVVSVIRFASATRAARAESWLCRRKWSILERQQWPLPYCNPEEPRTTADWKSVAAEGRHVANLQALATATLCERFALPPATQFRPDDLRNLAFSTLLPERQRLDRFRAASSLTRGLATVTALSATAYMLTLALPRSAGGWPVTTVGMAALSSLIIAFLALMERSEMYDALWGSVIIPQYLIAATRDDRSPQDRTPAVPSARQLETHTNSAAETQLTPRVGLNLVATPSGSLTPAITPISLGATLQHDETERPTQVAKK